MLTDYYQKIEFSIVVPSTQVMSLLTKEDRERRDDAPVRIDEVNA